MKRMWMLAGLTGCVAAGTALLVARPSPVERGRYLVSVMACDDCHTPLKPGSNGPEPDVSRTLSGHPERVTFTRAPALGNGWTWAGSDTNTAFIGPWGQLCGRLRLIAIRSACGPCRCLSPRLNLKLQTATDHAADAAPRCTASDSTSGPPYAIPVHAGASGQPRAGLRSAEADQTLEAVSQPHS